MHLSILFFGLEWAAAPVARISLLLACLRERWHKIEKRSRPEVPVSISLAKIHAEACVSKLEFSALCPWWICWAHGKTLLCNPIWAGSPRATWQLTAVKLGYWHKATIWAAKALQGSHRNCVYDNSDPSDEIEMKIPGAYEHGKRIVGDLGWYCARFLSAGLSFSP